MATKVKEEVKENKEKKTELNTDEVREALQAQLEHHINQVKESQALILKIQGGLEILEQVTTNNKENK